MTTMLSENYVKAVKGEMEEFEEWPTYVNRA